MKYKILHILCVCAIVFVCGSFGARGARAQGGVSGQGLGFGDFSDTYTHQMHLENSSTLLIHVVGKGGTRIEAPVKVELFLIPATTPANIPNMPDVPTHYQITAKDGHAAIDGVFGGQYTVQVSSPGYETHEEKLTVVGGFATTNCYFSLHPFDGSEDTIVWEQPGAPPVPVAARTELDAAIGQLSAGRPQQANGHLKNAMKRAPDSPDVHFVQGFYDEQTKNPNGAMQEYEQAIKLFPNHFAAQLNLGALLINQGKPADAIPHLEKALALGPNSWRGHWMLATAYLQGSKDTNLAIYHATMATQLGKDKALDAVITLGIAQGVSGDLPTGEATLQKFIADHPKDPRTADAKQALDELEHAKVVTYSVHGATAEEIVEDVPPSEMPGLPTPVDATVPIVRPDVTCNSDQVLAGAATSAKQFVNDLERFSARERVIHEDMTSKGGVIERLQKDFDYLATLEYPRPDLIVMDEMRNGNLGTAGQPGPVADEGIPAIALVFHPAYSKDFNFTCEGLGTWKGQLAWQVRFEQRDDRAARIRGWSHDGTLYLESLKGRAWLQAGSYNLLHVDTEMTKPIPAIKLDYEHMVIDYQPVLLDKTKGSLWLPSEAIVYSKSHGRYYKQDHQFSRFTLFSTEAKEKVGDAKDHQ